MAKLKLDLHPIFDNSNLIEKSLKSIIDEAHQKRIPLIEIITGKGKGQLKKKVLKFLEQTEVRNLYHRIDKDSKNFGRIFIRLQFKILLPAIYIFCYLNQSMLFYYSSPI